MNIFYKVKFTASNFTYLLFIKITIVILQNGYKIKEVYIKENYNFQWTEILSQKLLS